MIERLIVIGDKVKLEGEFTIVNKVEIEDEETGEKEIWYKLKLEGWDYEIVVCGEKDLRLCNDNDGGSSDACKRGV